MDRDIRFMNEALKEARYALADGEIPIGAVVVWRDSIIARGHNNDDIRDHIALCKSTERV